MAQSGLQGDVNHDGVVNFTDLSLLLANWEGFSQVSPDWSVIQPHIVKIYQRGVGTFEQTGSIVVLNLDADEVATRTGLPSKRGGVRGVSAQNWPEWPPVGSQLERLMDAHTSNPGSVEAAASQVLMLLH